jgi:hypothetical protein
MSGSKRVRITRAQFTTMVVNSIRTVGGERPDSTQLASIGRWYDPAMTIADAKFLVQQAVNECCYTEATVSGAFDPLWTKAEYREQLERMVAKVGKRTAK